MWADPGHTREKDREFVGALLRHGITTPQEIEERLRELDGATVSQIRPRLKTAIAIAST
jgi:hypothetical protein